MVCWYMKIYVGKFQKYVTYNVKKIIRCENIQTWNAQQLYTLWRHITSHHYMSHYQVMVYIICTNYENTLCNKPCLPNNTIGVLKLWRRNTSFNCDDSTFIQTMLTKYIIMTQTCTMNDETETIMTSNPHTKWQLMVVVFKWTNYISQKVNRNYQLQKKPGTKTWWQFVNDSTVLIYKVAIINTFYLLSSLLIRFTLNTIRRHLRQQHHKCQWYPQQNKGRSQTTIGSSFGSTNIK